MQINYQSSTIDKIIFYLSTRSFWCNERVDKVNSREFGRQVIIELGLKSLDIAGAEHSVVRIGERETE